MKILVLGNYPYLRSQSMDRFANMLYEGLKDAGHCVYLLKPKPVLGCLLPSATGIGKWLGYVDRFLFFRPILKAAVEWADVVHICDQANAVYVPILRTKPHVVTCHDMIEVRSALGEFAEHAPGPTGKIYQKWILSGLKRARHVACVSKATYKDALRLLKSEDGRLSLVPNCLNYPYRRMGMRESSHYLNQMRLSIHRPFFLHVGGNFWNKNKEGLLCIFAELRKFDEFRQHLLVLAGEVLDHRMHQLAEKIGIHSLLREPGSVSNQQLCALYSFAKGLIFPSYAEGFGWPIIEAQACGCPVFTSDRSPMNDISGRAAVYFDPTNASGAAKVIREKFRKTNIMRTLGYHNAEQYTTNGMITNYVNCYYKSMRLCIKTK